MQYGGVFALPGIAEKGSIDFRVEVNSPGGHSSIPPDHTVRTNIAVSQLSVTKHSSFSHKY